MLYCIGPGVVHGLDFNNDIFIWLSYTNHNTISTMIIIIIIIY